MPSFGDKNFSKKSDFCPNRVLIMFNIPYLRITIIIFLCGWNSSQADLPVAKEYQIKSVFLYNFSYFIKWPETVFSSNDAPFHFCILGEDLFKRGIDLAVKHENGLSVLEASTNNGQVNC
ncbi:MAG: hypothetical protein DRQ49_02320 [Gammaproteobacteria bacterium]|nr:MAG: hypothetical protein DRQ49_02320 [Gammaproteobacteria bacterium]RKZ74463.1 MAG: hypothetical protein DRQ57_10965 [Gammaproteobacteria bacterium]